MALPHREVASPTAILELVRRWPDGILTSEICDRLRVTPQMLGDIFEGLREDGQLLGFAGLWLTPEQYRQGCSRFLKALSEEHGKTPSVPGIPGDQVARAAGLAWQGKPLDRILAELAARGLVSVSNGEVREGSFRPDLPARQRRFLDRAIEAIEREPITVPPPHEIARTLGAPHQAVQEILRIGVQSGELVAIGDSFYTPRQVDALREQMRRLFNTQPFSANDFREKLDLTRRHSEPLLEFFDSVSFTVREGNRRTIRP
jgi:selenocysteine-specific elongation factor